MKKKWLDRMRAPLARIGERGAYRFWNGSAWVSDVRDARAVMQKIPGAVSVSFNPYLQQYIAVHSAPLSNNIVIQRADHPEGAWSDPVIAFSGIATSPGRVDYAGIEHPELMQNNGRTIFASYYHLQNIFRGELRLVEINFK